MKSPNDDVVSIRIVPPAVGTKNRRRAFLPAILEQLDLVVQVLRSFASDPKATVELRGVTMNSPVTVDACAVGESGRSLPAAGRQMMEFIESIEADNVPRDSTPDILLALQRLAKEATQGYEITLKVGPHSRTLSESLVSQIDALIGTVRVERGSFVGELLRINLRESSRLFYIYPQFGPKRIACRFPSTMRADLESVTGQMVRVSGTLRYTQYSTFPSEIEVDSVTMIPEASSESFDRLMQGIETHFSGELHRLPSPL